MTTKNEFDVRCEINMRRHYTIETTNMFTDSVTPSWKHAWTFKGTPRQCVAEYRDFKRKSGGCFTSVRGIEVDWSALLDVVILAEIDS